MYTNAKTLTASNWLLASYKNSYWKPWLKHILWPIISWDGSNEGSQDILLLRNKKNYLWIILSIPSYLELWWCGFPGLLDWRNWSDIAQGSQTHCTVLERRVLMKGEYSIHFSKARHFRKTIFWICIKVRSKMRNKVLYESKSQAKHKS